VTSILKLGGELLETPTSITDAATAIGRMASTGPVVVVHGGGRAIDAELKRRGLAPRFADGLRVTDADTLDAVVTVLAGRNNTQLVAAINASGVKAVGLTGADAQLGLCVPVAPIRTQAGEIVDLGLVGEPADCNTALLAELLHLGYVPVIASIGITADGALLNINADVFAAYMAVALEADRLVIAGTTPGVMDAGGQTIPVLTPDDIDALASSGTAHSGMLAKLAACRHAAVHGVSDVWIVSGADVIAPDAAGGTRVTAPVNAAGDRRSKPAGIC
jgi:acetylglutamate kinase